MSHPAEIEPHSLASDPWGTRAGRELTTDTIDVGAPPAWQRVVACLNVWNDRAALEQTIARWLPHVDHVIAVDGAYVTTGAEVGESTDGTLEFLRAAIGDRLELVEAAGLWPDQLAKRNAYLSCDRARAGDLLFVVDADEFVTGGERLRALPPLDVGWVRITSPLYERAYGQPRLIRWTPDVEYGGRHHWLYAGARVLATHQYGGTGVEHRPIPITIHNARQLGWSTERWAAKQRHAQAQHALEQDLVSGATAMSDQTDGTREALRIVQVGRFDAGLAASRLHAAINRTTPHTSLLFTLEPGPFGAPAQFTLPRDFRALPPASATADVLHCHLTLAEWRAFKRPARVVLHHHGSLFRKRPADLAAQARDLDALVLVSNLELFSYTDGTAEWLPNPMPIARYRRIRAAQFLERTGDRVARRPFRIAHSPSKPHLKGTAQFLAACGRLDRLGIDVEPVVITGVPHGEALAIKATCDACFDAFWLGLQCSGLEAAAMGMPVIAGDHTVADRALLRFGAVPYTFANTRTALEDAIVRLVRDPEYCAAEAARVAAYTLEHHDEAAVALRYLDLLDAKWHWRAGL